MAEFLASNVKGFDYAIGYNCTSGYLQSNGLIIRDVKASCCFKTVSKQERAERKRLGLFKQYRPCG